MNANSVNIRENHTLRKRVELGSYGLLAVCLIGHVFFIESQLTFLNIALLGLGTVFGMLLTLGWAPITEQLPKPVRTQLAEVLSFDSNEKTTTKQEHNQHAA